MTAQALVDQGLVTPPTPDPAAITPSLTITNIPTIMPTPGDTATPTLDVIMGTPEPLTLPDPLPQAEIQIINPGRLSRVIPLSNCMSTWPCPRANRKKIPLS